MKIKNAVCLMLILISSYGYASTLKYVPGIKLGKGVVAIINDVEYERNLVPFTTGYLRFGGAGFDLPGASKVKVNFSNVGFGVRYNLILFYVGTGFESSQVKMKDSVTDGTASGTIAGPIIEVGKTMGLGPISVGASLGLQFATNKIQYNDNSSFNLGDLNANGSATLVKLEFQAGYSF